MMMAREGEQNEDVIVPTSRGGGKRERSHEEEAEDGKEERE